MMHLAIYDASIANGSVLVQVAALADPKIAPAGSGLLVNKDVPMIGRVAAVGTNLTRVQLTSATIRDYTPFDIGPVNVGTVIENPPRYLDFMDNPIPLAVDEELDAFGVQSNAGAQRITVAVWFTDGPRRKVTTGRPFSVHWTSSTTLTANALTSFQPTLDNGLPSGTFAIVGLRVISAGALLARLIPRGTTNIRPGVLAFQGQDGGPDREERYGAMGELLRFTNTTPPQIEVFSRSADTTEEGYYDLIQVG